jgi:CRISP-associated protein Cas1
MNGRDKSIPNDKKDIPLIPARMLNEFVYCPRLAYMMWVQGEFAHNAYTVDGKIQHRRVDKKGGRLPPSDEEQEKIHARSVDLSSETLGVTARLDLVEGDGEGVRPVDYKRSKRPHVAGGAYPPERAQLCVQGLLLREHGYDCDAGILYYAASKERVTVRFDEELVAETRQAVVDLRAAAAAGEIPPPLPDSPKCPKCSLAGICLPDELRFLRDAGVEPRPIFSSVEKGLPLYVQSRRAALTTPALHECFRREIPVTYLSYGGWFMGHTVGTGNRNVETRTHQYRVSFDPDACLKLARGWVTAKIANCRVLIRRNRRDDDGDEKAQAELMGLMKMDMAAAAGAESMETLLGLEGAAASRYFRHFPNMLKSDPAAGLPFDFNTRNRRPPRDPINAMLSFGYAMLAREWTVALSAVGLDPYRGFYHQPRFGRPALSLDMMEPFRPLIADSAVLTAVNNGEVQPGDFIHAAGGCAMVDSGRKKFIAAFERRMGQEVTHPVFGYRLSYRRLLEVQARLLIRHLAGEIPRYPNFVTR